MPLIYSPTQPADRRVQIANYAVLLFTQLGLTGSIPLLLLAIWITISFPGNVITALYIDKWG